MGTILRLAIYAVAVFLIYFGVNAIGEGMVGGGIIAIIVGIVIGAIYHALKK